MKKKPRMKRPSRSIFPATPTSMDLGVAWYSAEDFALLRQQGVDVGIGCATYEEWVAEHEKIIARVQKQGIWPVKVPVTVPELTVWLQDRGLPNTTENRSEYVAWRVQQRGQR